MRSLPLQTTLCSTEAAWWMGQIPNLPEVVKSSLLKPQQPDHTLNVQFKQTRAADLPLAQPLPPLIAHDSVRNVMSHVLKAADVDK